MDATTGSVQCRAAFPNAGGLLLSGSAGEVIVPTIYKNSIVIPQTATYELQDKRYVYKLEDGKAVSAMIEVEKVSNGRDFIVTAGLTPGEVIVSEGVAMLREGTPIVPKGQTAAAPAETGSDRSPMIPAITMTIETTDASTGRSIKCLSVMGYSSLSF